MKFCSSCGTPLEFFEFLDGELCSSCLEKAKTKKPPSPQSEKQQSFELDEFSEMTIGVEDGKIVIKSPEGWILWSGSAHETQKLQTILSKAQRILKIRNKRKK